MFKMAEKFLSDPSLKENNIAKKTYFLKDDRIRLVYHLGEGKIIPSIREFRKPAPDQKIHTLDIIQNFTASPLEKSVKQQQLQLRVTEEQELSLSISIYDTLRNETKLQASDRTSTDNLKNVPESEKANNNNNNSKRKSLLLALLMWEEKLGESVENY